MSSAARPAEMGKEKEPQKTMQVLQMVLKGVLLFMLPQLLLMVVNGPVDGNGDETSGYWGPKTASVNWCERDYVETWLHFAVNGRTLFAPPKLYFHDFLPN